MSGLGDAANNLGSQLGMISALRTGNPMLDMAVCMLIPVFFQLLAQLAQHFQPLIQKITSWLNSGGDFYTRAIEFEVITVCFFLQIIAQYIFDILVPYDPLGKRHPQQWQGRAQQHIAESHHLVYWRNQEH